MNKTRITALGDSLTKGVILTEDNGRPIAVPIQGGDEMAAVDLADAGDGSSLPRCHSLEQKGIFRY